MPKKSAGPVFDAGGIAFTDILMLVVSWTWYFEVLGVRYKPSGDLRGRLVGRYYAGGYDRRNVSWQSGEMRRLLKASTMGDRSLCQSLL